MTPSDNSVCGIGILDSAVKRLTLAKLTVLLEWEVLLIDEFMSKELLIRTSQEE